MREIEFKAKKVDDGVWVYGDLIHHFSVKNGVRTDHVSIGVDCNFYEVILETVCQWTMLFDKDKTKLYDGDKFQYRKHDGYFLDDFVGVVKYKNGSFGFTVIGEASTGYFVPFSKFDELHEDFLDHIKVIGNIYDKEHQK